MNTRAAKAVESLRHALRRNPDTLMLFVAGSQAWGKPRPDSDIDLYHIAASGSKFESRHYDIIMDTAGMSADVTVDTLDTLYNASLYGSFEWKASRMGILVYENRAAPGRAVAREALRAEADMRDSTIRWLSCAGSLARLDCPGSMLCTLRAKSVMASIMAALTYDSVRFGLASGAVALAAMLRDGSLLCGHDMRRADGWLERGGAGYERDATRMANEIHCAVEEYCSWETSST